MAGVKLQSVDLQVTIFTALFQSRGKLRVSGVLQTFLNDEYKTTLSVMDAEVTTYDAGGPALRMSQPEFVIAKPSCEIVVFETPPAQGTISFLPHTETVVVYTDRLAMRGKFYMGTESNINTFVGATAGSFLVASDISIYPLVPINGEIVANGPLALVHKTAIRALHRA
ncbi:MAG TPA: hypothetical protein VMT34_07650 [Aggregatilineales bacterium]|nr:hypothetical protein [Aggregatilineales bacterium]